MKQIVLVLHNIRSIHNVGSIIRTADGFGVTQIIYSGYTPYPRVPNDTRLPHLTQSLTNRIHKTALGAETSVPGIYQEYPDVDNLRAEGYSLVGLEQDSRSVPLSEYSSPEKLVLIVGEEVEGISDELRDLCDTLLEIPMVGVKESFNVSAATAIALYQLTL